MNKDFEARHNETLKILSLLSKEAERLEEELVFLGGSAVQAILKNPKRLSIDLDVYYSGDAGKLVVVLEAESYKNTLRKSFDPGLFEFYTAKKGDVLVKMDFLKTRVPGRYTFKKELLEATTGKKFTAHIAKPEYLMAAKLSALAVGTIGRKEKSETLEIDIVKDVYDFNCLSDEFPDQNVQMAEVLHEIMTQQNKLRKTSYTMNDVYKSLEKNLRNLSYLGKKAFVGQGTLGNFMQHLYNGELSRSNLATAAMRILYHVKSIQRKESTTRGEKAAKEKIADRVYVSGCERELIEAGEDPLLLHELKIMAPKALIYLYYSKFLK
ncbi:nucleotidyl transferase AbiEii/AbiGii toxin family protein [Candidatus Micrarchaeota archaeon]|nr:nucleotidyl transferase AbiEii/AbiGii toxin family protein [Candidatus Micrarchaeota archaeon]MBU1165345.1 nucleotidyl transferase AbiEii/AbiGii toxin family protein [Candidatus Micrarchaeota archaeon]MBU1886255.1 nucleotidyl transferase AbiEii/AbiGii toxin family protein [Candidatus Micrarchaeota archaeon]